MVKYIYLCSGLETVVSTNLENKLRKADDRISILQLARSKSKKQIKMETRIEKDGFKSGSKLERKTVETFQVSYKRNCDQLLDMSNT